MTRQVIRPLFSQMTSLLAITRNMTQFRCTFLTFLAMYYLNIINGISLAKRAHIAAQMHGNSPNVELMASVFFPRRPAGAAVMEQPPFDLTQVPASGLAVTTDNLIGSALADQPVEGMQVEEDGGSL